MLESKRVKYSPCLFSQKHPQKHQTVSFFGVSSAKYGVDCVCGLWGDTVESLKRHVLTSKRHGLGVSFSKKTRFFEKAEVRKCRVGGGLQGLVRFLVCIY